MARFDSPRTLPEALRVLNRKSREQAKIPQMIHVGEWTITEDDAGNLVGIDGNGNSHTIAITT